MQIRQHTSGMAATEAERLRKARLAAHRLRSRTWKRANKDKQREYQRRYREKNREKLKAYNHAHYVANREHRNAVRRAWYYRNYDKVRPYLDAKQKARRQALAK